jgi:hypothetical protein
MAPGLEEGIFVSMIPIKRSHRSDCGGSEKDGGEA